MGALKERVYKLGDERFLTNSHQKVGRTLFEKLNLSAVKRPAKLLMQLI
jgi:DNA polymerase I-like protein with 3'-5' exonuclease and polymerase domains